MDMSPRSASPGVALAVAAICIGALLVGLPLTSKAGCFQPKARETKLAGRVNSARGRHSLGSLRVDPELTQAARVHAREMARAGTVQHTPTSVLAARVTRWSVLGENVGASRSIKRVMKKFMRSAMHRSNVLGTSYRHMGVGTLKSGRRVWVSVVFEARSDPGTTLEMPSC